MTEHCNNCYYARKAHQFPNKDNKQWYSCRYHAPMPYANEKQTTYKDWRIVPEDFWCGQYKTDRQDLDRPENDEVTFNPFDLRDFEGS